MFQCMYVLCHMALCQCPYKATARYRCLASPAMCHVSIPSPVLQTLDNKMKIAGDTKELWLMGKE